MGALEGRLRGLIAGVRRTGRPQAFTLERGLKIAARMIHDEIDGGASFVQLSLTRDDETAPSHTEAKVVIDALKWANAWTEEKTTRRGLPCIVINEGEPLFGAP